MNVNKLTLTAIRDILKNWWKVVIILFVLGGIIGLSISGYRFKFGSFSCDKEQVEIDKKND